MLAATVTAEEGRARAKSRMISLVNPADPRFGVKRRHHSSSTEGRESSLSRATFGADGRRRDSFSTVFSAGKSTRIIDARKTRSTRSFSPSPFLLFYPAPSLPRAVHPACSSSLLSLPFSLPLSSLPLARPLSLSLNTKRVSNDSMPWSRKCESTLLRALKVVLLEGILLERPWTVHREKSFAKECSVR